MSNIRIIACDYLGITVCDVNDSLACDDTKRSQHLKPGKEESQRSDGKSD